MSNSEIFIYLSGSIKKGNRTHVATFWDNDNLKKIQSSLLPTKICFLNPALRSDNLADTKSTFGRDMLQVFLSDMLIVDGREKRGVGVGAEMFFARLLNLPVISLIPHESHYRTSKIQQLGQNISDWTHPFMANLSSCVVPHFNALPQEIKNHISAKAQRKNIKDVFTSEYAFIFDAMKHYLKNQFKQDKEMLDIIDNHQCLNKKLSFLYLK